ncbi:unnamed protein product [Candida parapsilosis]|uniref:Zn(2)-C6 fungal-type domain-containing protein n=1 Tax=Candida parapsilosis (strain CDC 317 / ATCC MYA-4646) TaxID=578454 RepID=G8B6L2_CANPC|nr:uncharacterized protein CPAR2_101320 [Candida parapsilosis]KAI5903390.1 transcriptional regulatory protein STB4 [Candida parapsilosis]KAI5909681.1 transcriptional regulatory protein STB4 [Candida parapsilosis]CCE40094.1 hypothetical protein CPAR2_101320 [Candida parapsilosis]
MSKDTNNSEPPRVNLRDSRNLNSGMTPPSSGFSPYGAVQLPPVYSYRQSQQQQKQQPVSAPAPLQSSQESTYSGSPNPIAQPLQPAQSQTPQAADSRPRMRVSKACDRCRTHKIKCSGSDPCATCVRQKKECTFSNSGGGNPQGKSNGYPLLGADTNKRRKYSTLNSEPFGLPVVDKSNDKEYIAHLENRVQYLENLLSRNTMEDFRNPRFEEPENEGVIETLYTTSSKWRFSRRHQNLLIVELCKSMYSNLSEESKEKVTIPRMQYFGWNMSGVNYLTPENLPALPQLDIEFDERYLIDFFFKEVNPLFAIIHETVFREQYEAYDKLMKEEAMTGEHKHDSKSNQTKLYSAILYLIFALAIRFSEFQKPKSPDLEMLKLEEKLFKYGYKIVSILSFEWESFELIQSWLLIALYLRVAHRQTSSSHALGQAITMTKSMGLGFSEENYNILACTGYERLKAKRIFWCVFTFDRVFGLQTGRYCGIREEDFGRGFPGFDFQHETVKDDWLTLPALALLHIARISNFVHTAPTDNPHLIKYQQINAELVKLHQWFNEVGFRNDLLFNKHASSGLNENEVSSLVKAQVKLHYYDLVLCVHGKVLFNYIGRRIVSTGLKVEMVLDACHGVIEVLDKVNKAGLLYTPWYSVLLLLFNIGVNALCLINGGVFISQSRDLLKNTIKLFTILKKSPIRNKQNKLIFRERFKMVRECTWALKMANKILTLRLQEDMNALNNIGVDHGSSDVNKQYFSQLGFNDGAIGGAKDAGVATANATTNDSRNKLSSTPRSNEFNKVFEQQLYRHEDGSNVPHPILPRQEMQRSGTESPIWRGADTENHTPQAGGADDGSYVNSSNTPSSDNHEGGGAVDSYPSTEIDQMLSNLQWFDQWVDFTYDF